MSTEDAEEPPVELALEQAVPAVAAVPAPAAAPASAPTAATATPLSVLSTEPRSSERGKRAKPPFRLCFTVPGVVGRSALPPASTHAAPANAVTGKFYSREEERIRLQLLQRVLQEEAERAAAGTHCEEEAEARRGRDLLESARYGRYPRPLVVPMKGDRRLHFANRTSEMVRVQCHIARAAALASTGPSAGGHGGGLGSRSRQAAAAPVQATPAVG